MPRRVGRGSGWPVDSAPADHAHKEGYRARGTHRLHPDGARDLRPGGATLARETDEVDRIRAALGDRFAGLGLLRSLAEVGVGRHDFELIARNTMNDSWTYSNPRKIAGPEDVMGILHAAAG